MRHHLKSGNRWAKDWGVLTKAEKFEDWMAWKEGEFFREALREFVICETNSVGFAY